MRSLATPVDLDAAVEAARAAVEVTASDDPERGRYLSNLAVALRTRHERARDRDSAGNVDLDLAIDAARAAVTLAAADRPDRTDRLTIMAVTLLQAEGQHDTAIAMLREAAQHSAGRPAARMAAAQAWDEPLPTAGTSPQRPKDFLRRSGYCRCWSREKSPTATERFSAPGCFPA